MFAVEFVPALAFALLITASEFDCKPRTKKWFGLSETKWREIAGIAVLIPWVWNEFLDTHNFSKLCLLAITIAVAQGATLTFFKSRWRGFILAIWLISLVPVAVVVWINSRPEPKPNFIVSLQIGDSSATPILLTNDFLFGEQIFNSSNLSSGSISFNMRNKGCIVIPMKPTETNAVFNFTAENDSPLKINDLVATVGFPNNWKGGADSAKWRPSSEHLIIEGWKIQSTNEQYWTAECPWPLFPSDSVTFPPVTNFSIPEFNSSTNKNGFFDLTIRCTGFAGMISANVLFIRTTNFSKPFLTTMKQGTDGLWRVSISQKQFEDSQK
jgi:hypothetical protein